MFLRSALYQPKRERDDYRERTIDPGIEACHGTFHKSVMARPYFVRFNKMSGEPYIVVPLLALYVREHLKYILVRDSGRQGLLKYVYEGGVLIGLISLNGEISGADTTKADKPATLYLCFGDKPPCRMMRPGRHRQSRGCLYDL